MLTSRTNPTIKAIRALRQRKEREATQHFLIEGIRIVAEAIECRAPLESLVVAPELLTSSYALDLVQYQREHGTSIIETSADVFASLSHKDHPQGLAGVGLQRWHTLDQLDPNIGLCWIALNAISDPGNLGTIVRTSDAVGGAGVILLGDCTDPYDPTAIRASMGALFSQTLIKATWNEFTTWQHRHAWHVVGAADSASVHYRQHEFKKPLILLMGSEREGLSSEQQAMCDAMVSLPMRGVSDSLNLAVATGVLLYEILEQLNHG